MVVTDKPPRRSSKLGISSVTNKRDDDGDGIVVVDNQDIFVDNHDNDNDNNNDNNKNDGHKRQFFSDDIKSCPFPFNCFDKTYLFCHVTNDATGVSKYITIIYRCTLFEIVQYAHALQLLR